MLYENENTAAADTALIDDALDDPLIEGMFIPIQMQSGSSQLFARVQSTLEFVPGNTNWRSVPEKQHNAPTTGGISTHGEKPTGEADNHSNTFTLSQHINARRQKKDQISLLVASPANYVVSTIISVTAILVGQHTNTRLMKRRSPIDGAIIASALTAGILFVQSSLQPLTTASTIQSTASFIQAVLVVAFRQAVSVIMAVQLNRLLEHFSPSFTDTNSLAAWVSELPWELYALALTTISFAALVSQNPSKQAGETRHAQNAPTLLQQQLRKPRVANLIRDALLSIVFLTNVLLTQHAGLRITAQQTPFNGVLLTVSFLFAMLLVASARDDAGPEKPSGTKRLIYRLVVTSALQAASILVALQLNRLLETFTIGPTDADTIAGWVAEFPWELYILIIVVMFVVALGTSNTMTANTLGINSVFFGDLTYTSAELISYVGVEVSNIIGVTSVLITQHAGSKITMQHSPFDGFVIAACGLATVIFFESAMDDRPVNSATQAPSLGLSYRVLIDTLRQGANVILSIQLNRLLEYLTIGTIRSDISVWWLADFPWELYLLSVLFVMILPLFESK